MMKLNNYFIAITLTLMMFSIKIWDATESDNVDVRATNSYYLKAKVDGAWMEFNQESGLNASFGPYIDTIYDGVINASNFDTEQQSVINSMTIIIRQIGKIGIGSYSGGKVFEYGFKGVTISYTDASNSAIYVTDVNNPQSFLKITETTDTYIKGTFSGESIHIMNKAKIVITEGEFYVRSNSY